MPMRSLYRRKIVFQFVKGRSYPQLAKAVALAWRFGADAATTVLQEGLMSEDTFYRSFARALGALFLDDEVKLDRSLNHRTVLNAGASRLAPG